MSESAAIYEMDSERDRKTCVALDLKVSGANQELAQWLLDHPRYSGEVVGGRLGCSKSRIAYLRKWAREGFHGTPFDRTNKPDERYRHDASSTPSGNAPLKSQDNSEPTQDSDDAHDPDAVADPAVVEENALDVLGRITASP
jgi:hypothetical protein